MLSITFSYDMDNLIYASTGTPSAFKFRTNFD